MIAVIADKVNDFAGNSFDFTVGVTALKKCHIFRLVGIYKVLCPISEKLV